METYLQSDLTIYQLRQQIEQMKLLNVVSWSFSSYWHPGRTEALYTFAMMYIPANPSGL